MKITFEITKATVKEISTAMAVQFPIPEIDGKPQFNEVEWVKHQVKEFLIGITDSHKYEIERKKIKISSVSGKIK